MLFNDNSLCSHEIMFIVKFRLSSFKENGYADVNYETLRQSYTMSKLRPFWPSANFNVEMLSDFLYLDQ